MTLESSIAQGTATMGIEVPLEAPARLARYLELIEKWNRVHNLTAVRDTAQMVVLHVLDSLALLPHLEGCSSILDVGTGPGLPGIPVAIAMPRARVTLLDSSHKKCAFLEQARIELGLDNVEVVCERIEQWTPARAFDAVVSRAFSDLSDFVLQAKHAVAPGGRMIAMKGVYPFDEIARVPPTHKVAQVVELQVAQLEAKRHLVFVEAA
ncbi:MAG TPA: 16S rRNA (guanine(527)-N(7))-methyltransferase RsmG [Usitatibacter sp.]|jgi:16S rRNA (guanine527-N7)-methyltransferase|nr:16S rRNA (guanine(527)-N(7))-methyltransferase RsmG [Usitatibacter sp.]